MNVVGGRDTSQLSFLLHNYIPGDAWDLAEVTELEDVSSKQGFHAVRLGSSNIIHCPHGHIQA